MWKTARSIDPIDEKEFSEHTTKLQIIMNSDHKTTEHSHSMGGAG